LGAAKPDAVLAGAGAPGEVARGGAQAVATGRRRLAHADAAVAAGLVQARAGGEQDAEQAVLRQGHDELAGGRVDVEGDLVGDTAAADDLGGDGEVAVTGVGRRADVRLIDRLTGDLFDRHDLAGARWPGDERYEGREIDL